MEWGVSVSMGVVGGVVRRTPRVARLHCSCAYDDVMVWYGMGMVVLHSACACHSWRVGHVCVCVWCVILFVLCCFLVDIRISVDVGRYG